MTEAFLPVLHAAAQRRLAFALAAVLAAVSCAKEKPSAEKAAKEAAPAPAKPAPTETAAPERKPTILSSAAPNMAPFTGLHGPRAACIDEKGRLWVANFGDNEIRIFDLAGGYFGGWGNRGTANTQFKDPAGISIKGDDVYVADTWNGRVVRFSASGQWKGQAPGDFYGPRSVAVAPDRKVWVSDTGNQRIVLLDGDLSNPRRFGRKGSGPDEFLSPVGIAVDREGNVYVADADNHRISIMDSEGRFKARWKFAGWGANTEPYLAVDADGTVYATDSGARAVVQMSKSAAEARRWTADDTGEKFERPTGIALDPRGRILYVVNTDSGTIVKLKLSPKS